MKLKQWFTIIEMMIAITIVAIISMATYAPYGYYKKKAKLRNTASLITQVLYDSRNMAINWVVWINWNVSIWVLFDNSNKNEITIFSYPHNIDTINIWYSENTDIKIINKIYLPEWIQIDSIEWKDNLLFVFDSIHWSVKFLNKSVMWSITEVSWSSYDKIDIIFSYRWSSSINLQKTIFYFSSTNIIDY